MIIATPIYFRDCTGPYDTFSFNSICSLSFVVGRITSSYTGACKEVPGGFVAWGWTVEGKS